MATDTALSPGRTLSISRLVDAPRDLVWKVWTEPDHIKNWWGPNGFTNTIFEMEVKPKGVWDFIMHGPDGTDYKNKSIYKEIVKYEKIVYDHMSGPKFQFTVTFTEKGKKTLIDIQMLFETAEERENVVKVFKADTGLKENIYKLEGYIRKISAEKEMTLTRILDAPREMVFKAWIDRGQLVKWWGPKGFTNPVCDVDTRPGGKILIHMLAPDGMVHPMDGEFHEIVEPEKIVFTSAALDKNGKRLFEVLNTVTFKEENGKTKLTLHAAVSHITDEGRPYLDGMNEGWNQSIDRLDQLTSPKTTLKYSPVLLERTFNCAVKKVWKALTDNDEMKQWYFDLAEFKPEPGFEFQFYGEGRKGEKYLHLCKITKLIPLQLLQYSWRYDGYPGTSLVTFELLKNGNKTRLRLTHQGLETFPADNPDFAKESFIEGWTYIISKSLKEFLEK
jgi:uncharacterized protein YndB with AHSA1/START domain